MNSEATKRIGLISYKEILFESLRQYPQEAIDGMHVSLKDEDPDIFLLAVQDTLEAYDGHITEQISSEIANLYLVLAENCDERFHGMQELLKAFKIQLPDGKHLNEEKKNCAA